MHRSDNVATQLELATRERDVLKRDKERLTTQVKTLTETVRKTNNERKLLEQKVLTFLAADLILMVAFTTAISCRASKWYTGCYSAVQYSHLFYRGGAVGAAHKDRGPKETA